MSDKKLIKVQVLSTDKVVFEGDVDRITSFNEVGTFDVFPMHANFISIIGQKLAFFNKGKLLNELKFEQAVMKVKKDVVYIFLGIEVLLLDDKELNPEAKAPVKMAEKK